MGTGSKAFLLVSGDVDGENTRDEVALNDWWTNEHLAERLRLPGFHRARRYYNRSYHDDGNRSTRYLALYDVASIHDLASPEYIHALNNPTDATKKYMPFLARLQRSACWLIFEIESTRSSASVMGNWLLTWSLVVPGPGPVEEQIRSAMMPFTERCLQISRFTCLHEDHYATSVGSRSSSYDRVGFATGLEDQPMGHKYILLFDITVASNEEAYVRDLSRGLGLTDAVSCILDRVGAVDCESQAFQFLCSAESK
jgi:hypothetical protein